MQDTSFYKSKKFFMYERIPRKIREKQYDQKAYERCIADIKSVVGDKEKYTIFDAAEFFQTKYHAFQVPWDKMLQYRKGKILTKFYDSSGLDDSEMIPFDYAGNKEHKNVTLIIDLVHNRDLREKYPEIVQVEKRKKEEEAADPMLSISLNNFIVIGTFDWETIESMYTDTIIDDVYYEILYFYEHS